MAPCAPTISVSARNKRSTTRGKSSVAVSSWPTWLSKASLSRRRFLPRQAPMRALSNTGSKGLGR